MQHMKDSYDEDICSGVLTGHIHSSSHDTAIK